MTKAKFRLIVTSILISVFLINYEALAQTNAPSIGIPEQLTTPGLTLPKITTREDLKKKLLIIDGFKTCSDGTRTVMMPNAFQLNDSWQCAVRSCAHGCKQCDEIKVCETPFWDPNGPMRYSTTKVCYCIC